MRPHTRIVLLGGLFSGLVVPSTACGAEPPASSAPFAPSLPILDRFRGLTEGLAGFDWDQEAERGNAAAEAIWRRNGWVDEADRFARETACEVNRIPPWENMARLHLLSVRVAERYGLDPARAQTLEMGVIREAGMMLGKHGAALFEHTKEALSARARGEPYTAQQVQRWSGVLEPLLNDARTTVERLAQEIAPGLSPEAREKLDRDLASVRKRERVLDEMRVRWTEGKWQPSDWGLEKDPIQTRVPMNDTYSPPPAIGQPVVAQTVEAQTASIPKQWFWHDPTTWIAYVVHTQRRFGFDAAQCVTANSIHTELLSRATDYLNTHRENLGPVPWAQREAHAGFEPIRAIFTELQDRVGALPTSSQRTAAGE